MAPLRQVSIPQARLIKERAPFLPHQGARRVFLIDHVDRANEQAANSLLKDSGGAARAPHHHHDRGECLRPAAHHPLPGPCHFSFAPLGQEEMRQFIQSRELDQPERRMALAGGQSGYRRVTWTWPHRQAPRRHAAVIEGGRRGHAFRRLDSPFPRPIGLQQSRQAGFLFEGCSTSFCAISCCYMREVADIRNVDIRRELESLAGSIQFAWIRKAVKLVDERGGATPP